MLLYSKKEARGSNRVFKGTADLIYNNLLFVSPSKTWNPAEQFNILDLSFYYRLQKSQRQKQLLV